MPRIGEFHETDFGFSGAIHTRDGKSEIDLVRTANKEQGGPDYNALAPNGAEIGAGWDNTAARSGNPYVRVNIDDVTMPQKIQGNLVHEGDGVWGLIWNREKERSSQQDGPSLSAPTPDRGIGASRDQTPTSQVERSR